MNAFDIIKTVRVTEKGTRQGEKYNQYTVVADPRRGNLSAPCAGPRNQPRNRSARRTGPVGCAGFARFGPRPRCA